MFLKKNLFLISLFSFFFIGCSFNIFNGYHKVEKRTVKENEVYSLFKKDTGTYFFQTSLQILNNEISGMMVFKPSANNSCRVIFLNEIGIKYFDIDFFNIQKNDSIDNFKIHYCMEALNRKPFINMLKNDIGLLLMNLNKNERCIEFSQNDFENKILKIKNKGEKNYYFYNVKTNRIKRILKTSGIFKKVYIDFYQNSDLFPDSIVISHFNIHFKMQLNTLSKN